MHSESIKQDIGMVHPKSHTVHLKVSPCRSITKSLMMATSLKY